MQSEQKRSSTPEVLEEYIKAKEEHKEQYERKKATQLNAKQRRAFIRELKEDRDWS